LQNQAGRIGNWSRRNLTGMSRSEGSQNLILEEMSMLFVKKKQGLYFLQSYAMPVTLKFQFGYACVHVFAVPPYMEIPQRLSLQLLSFVLQIGI
jgi:hypothetical protein